MKNGREAKREEKKKKSVGNLLTCPLKNERYSESSHSSLTL